MYSILILLGCSAERPQAKPQTEPQAEPQAALRAEPLTIPTPTGYDRELARLDAQLARWQAREGWTAGEQATQTLLTRARLTGNYNDYARATATLEEAFSQAPAGSGPLLTRAQLNYTLHRLAPVQRDLDTYRARVLLSDGERAGLDLAQANVNFQRGEYAKALAGFETSLKEKRTMRGLCALSQYYWKTGDPAQAEALLDEAEGMYHGLWNEPRAWLHLQRGLMDLERGRYDEALAHYRDADAILDGYWLVQEHIAEVLTLTGQTDEALTIYRDVVDRTGNPELMGAMASIYAAQGQEALAQQWVDRAEAVHRQTMAAFPEAAIGHALKHFLTWGPPEEALAMAQDNLALRPNALARIDLARALLRVDQPEQALAALRPALESPWDTAALHAVASEVYAALGQTALVASHRAAAEAIRPDALTWATVSL